jgi:pyridoxine/pyridoxamine 5'-phosphate oxidase
VTILPPVVLHEFAGHPAEPSVLLRRWLADAEAAGEDDPFTAVLATADALGQPSTRCVAVRSVEERGLVMFANLNTRKGRDLHANPRAAITFYWPSLLRQVNITGHVELTGEQESDALWDARGLPGQVASLSPRKARSWMTTSCWSHVPPSSPPPGRRSRGRKDRPA